MEPADACFVPHRRTSAYSRALWHAFHSALHMKNIALVRFDYFIICSPQSANILWENHFQLEETNYECGKGRVMSQIWPLFKNNIEEQIS